MTSEDRVAIQKADFDRMAEGNLEAVLNEEPRAGADRKLTSNEEALLIATGGHPRPLNIRKLMYFRMGFIIHLTYQYICGIMSLWELMCPSHITHHRNRVRVSFACNTGTPFGVLLIPGDFFND
jgi:hypothetical protein